ncbi:initiator tRNA phosphoribosyl transferase [Saitoella complicata NRRL Y-17804]|nr:initiator tRNA phosphoribosyl transferase [Saitoella complicata NRRL Y-17804]ODQ54581.1 initiator tRNA phosphoribosyl transferase [Saitoella complicata NRRL Y-17804]
MNFGHDFALKDSAKEFKCVTQTLRQESRSIYNRLHSIAHDASFVQFVASAYNLPLIANERCGLWYIQPNDLVGSVYFKSTDGHHGQWSFSLRRLNLHLPALLEEHGGAVIVDSTRRGKRMPDSLSKTIPIWCAVMNRAYAKLHPEAGWSGDDVALHTPPSTVSRAEHASIEERLDRFVDSLLSVLPSPPQLSKPLRSLWHTPTSTLPPLPPTWDEFTPIVLCTASEYVDAPEGTTSMESGWTYVQGAADDHELWSHGLNPSTFWDNSEKLLAAAPSDVEKFVKRTTSTPNPRSAPSYDRVGNTRIWVGNRASTGVRKWDAVVNCSLKYAEIEEGCPYLHLKIPEGKPGRKELSRRLPEVVEWVRSNGFITRPKMADGNAGGVLVVCDQGRDRSVGTALALLSIFYDDGAKFRDLGEPNGILKEYIRKRLVWITSSREKANPSGATLGAVNHYLMS